MQSCIQNAKNRRKTGPQQIPAPAKFPLSMGIVESYVFIF